MFDVIHVLYEEDITPQWEQHIDVKDQIRKALYPLLYNQPYNFAVSKGSGDAPSVPEGFETPAPSAPGSGPREVKPYIPPTDPEDLMKILDAPMGGY